MEADSRNGQRNIAFSDSYRPKYYGQSLYEVQRQLGRRYEEEFAQKLGILQEEIYSWLEGQVQARIQALKLSVLPR